MVKLNWAQNKNEISNEAGVQLSGNMGPNLDGGLSPKELLEGAVALCLSITLQKVLERDAVKADLNEIEIDVVASKAEGGQNHFAKFEVQVTFPSTFETAYKAKLLKVIERGCTISNTLVNDVAVEIVER